jgi:hypothetical protein
MTRLLEVMPIARIRFDSSSTTPAAQKYDQLILLDSLERQREFSRFPVSLYDRASCTTAPLFCRRGGVRCSFGADADGARGTNTDKVQAKIITKILQSNCLPTLLLCIWLHGFIASPSGACVLSDCDVAGSRRASLVQLPVKMSTVT